MSQYYFVDYNWMSNPTYLSHRIHCRLAKFMWQVVSLDKTDAMLSLMSQSRLAKVGRELNAETTGIP